MTYSSRSNVVRMITRMGRPSVAMRVMCSVAVMPSMPGMRTSISTMSGVSCSASRIASSPFEAWPTTCMSGCELITMVKPARTSS